MAHICCAAQCWRVWSWSCQELLQFSAGYEAAQRPAQCGDLCCCSPQCTAHEAVNSTSALRVPIPLFTAEQTCFFWVGMSICLGPGSLNSSLLWISGYYEEKTYSPWQTTAREGQFSVIPWPASKAILSSEMIKYIFCVEGFLSNWLQTNRKYEYKILLVTWISN